MQFTSLKRLGLGLVVILVVASVTWATPVIVNPSFESAPCAAPGQPPYYCTIDSNDVLLPGFGWTVNQYGIDNTSSVDWVIWNAVDGFAWAAADGTHSIDLNGITRGGISQTISGFVVGQEYTLSFALTGSPFFDLPLTDQLKQLEVFMDGVSLGNRYYDITLNDPQRTDMQWAFVNVHIPASVVANTQMVLEFKSLNDGQNDYAWGPVIDAVSITEGNIPEPGTFSLFAGAGLLALTAAIRRRRR